MADWHRFLDGARDIDVVDDAVVVRFNNQRQQRIDVRPTTDAIELLSVVARSGVVDGLDEVSLTAWQRNRAASLVGFRVDQRGRLVGESWVPTAGLTRDEFLLYVRGLAAACDLCEFQLTGKDRE